MSVHTLTVENDMVQIGACVTLAEALAAGPQILRFCYEINNRPAPLVLDPPEVLPAWRASCPDGLVEAREGTIVFAPHIGAPMVINDPTALAAALATVHERARHEPDPDEVRALAEFLDTAMDTDPETLARTVLTRFNLEERP